MLPCIEKLLFLGRMKIFSHYPLRSSWANIFTASSSKKRLLTKGDIYNNIKEMRKQKELALQKHLMRPSHRRVGRVKRATQNGVKGYHVVGLGFKAAETFEQIKQIMRAENYTHFVMGAVKGSL